MPIQHAIWKVGDTPQPLSLSQLASEQKLEEMIVRDPRILSGEWMLIGRQEITSYGGRINYPQVPNRRDNYRASGLVLRHIPAFRFRQFCR